MPEPNAKLKSRREGVALSQAELAEQVGVAEMTIRRWEAGLRPQPAHLRCLCAALGASPAELGFGPRHDPGPRDKLSSTGTTLDILPKDRPDAPVVDAPTLLEALATDLHPQPPAQLASPVGPEPGLPQPTSECGTPLVTNLGRQPPPAGSSAHAGLPGPAPIPMPDPGSQDEVVGSTSYTGCRLSQFRIRGSRGDVLMGVADESARFLRDTESTGIGSLTLEQLEADLRRLAHAYLNQPLDELFFPTVGLRNVVFTLLERNRYPEQARHLYLMAGQACLLLAKASKDFGSLPAAETHARTAWLCAELADHHDLRAWVRVYQGAIAYWDDRPADALHFIEDGQRFPAQGSVTLYLPSLHARAAGHLGDPGAIAAALLAADAAGERTQPDDLAGGWFLFPPAEQALYAADAYTALADGRLAARHAQQAIAHYQAIPADDLFLDHLHQAQCNLATALLDQDQLEGAADALRPVLATPPQHRSLPVTTGLRIFDRRLLTHPTAASTPLARQLHDEITEFCAHPLTPQLPTA